MSAMNTNDDLNPGLPAPIAAPSRSIEVIPPFAWDDRSEFARRLAPPPKNAWRFRLGVAAAVAVVAIAASGATLAVANRHTAAQFAEKAQETDTLARTVATLSARLDSIEKAKPRDDIADIKRALGDLKSASSKDIDSALARVSQRAEALDRQQSAKVDKIDRSNDTKAAELAARLDRLEKKVTAAPGPSPAAKLASAKPAPPKFGPGVSMETTGSIQTGQRPPERPVLRGYVVLGARPDAAIIADAWGEHAVRVGDLLPGAGRVERIERQGPAWIVQTNAGVIPPAGSAAD
jgi:hypothetical protein